MSSSTKAW